MEEEYFEHLMEFEANFPAPGCTVSAATHARLFNADFPSQRENDELFLPVRDEARISREFNERLLSLKILMFAIMFW